MISIILTPETTARKKNSIIGFENVRRCAFKTSYRRPFAWKVKGRRHKGVKNSVEISVVAG
jgi:hypothetical protein